MEPWLIPLLSLVIGIVGGIIGGHIGVKVAIGELKVRVTTIEHEVELLRKAKHDHAGFLTQHELRLTNLEREGR